MAEPVVRLLQITDMHLQQEAETLMKGADVEMRFQRVLQEVATQSADALLLTGDLTHHAPAAYQRLVNYVSPLSYPCYWIPGNHDLTGEMYQFAEQGLGQKILEFKNWRILLLDSTANPDGRGGGALSEPELEFLRTELEETKAEQHVLVVLHHHPVSVNSLWQDQIALANADQFWSILDCFAQVKGVVFGHVHQAWQLQRGDVRLFSAPATAPQFRKSTDTSEIEDDLLLSAPGFASYELFPDGNIHCQIERVVL